MMTLEEVVQAFTLLPVRHAAPLGAGHIHDTYLVQTVAENPDYVLQRINTDVFQEPAAMMDNIQAVCQHLAQSGPEDSALILIPALDGAPYCQDAGAVCWRMYRFWPHLQAFDQPRHLTDIREGAWAFGDFLRRMDDFPLNQLHIPLPNFHHVPIRVQQLIAAIKNGQAARVAETKALWTQALALEVEMSRIQRAGDRGAFPLRCTHNDTKFNNVLLTAAGKGRCVIDLDTVMPGWVHMDLGDGMRTTACPAPEDHPLPVEMQADMTRAAAFLEGYLTACGGLLTESERQFLPQAPAMLAYLMGIRFLADYLLGDVYYKIEHPAHNRQRAAAQLALAVDFQARQADIARLIQQAS